MKPFLPRPKQLSRNMSIMTCVLFVDNSVLLGYRCLQSEFKLYTFVTSRQLQYLIQPVNTRLAHVILYQVEVIRIKIVMQSAYTSVIEQLLLKWNGHDCDSSMHDAIGFYCIVM